jgi:hypothetical protein
MLIVMISLLALLAMWKCMWREDRFFHSLMSISQKFLSLVQPVLAKAHPSGRLLTPSGLPSELVTSGFPKLGYLSTYAQMVESILVRPALMLNQVFMMFFQNEEGGFFCFGATKI